MPCSCMHPPLRHGSMYCNVDVVHRRPLETQGASSEPAGASGAMCRVGVILHSVRYLTFGR